MNINIYEDYKIKVTGNYIRLSEENENIYDNIFIHDNINEEVILNGGELLDIIGARLLDNCISEFVIVENEIHFETFNPNNGESSSICYEIKESKEINKS